MLSFSEACERNKRPILEILKKAFKKSQMVLEIGSGTGQHAVYFSQNLSHLTWQPTDLPENCPGVQARLAQEGPHNVKPTLALDVAQQPWPVTSVDSIFTANTLHIMSWEHVTHFFQGMGPILQPGGMVCIYGPFRYQGNYTSESNAQFDTYLQARDPLSGIRDFEAVQQLAEKQGLSLVQDYAMPANNQTLVWQRTNSETIRDI